MADREDSIRAAVALKAAVEYAKRDPGFQLANVLEAAIMFEQWLAEREGSGNGISSSQAPPVQASSPPQSEPVWGCPICGTAPMKLRTGRNGEFYGCERYPDCKGTRERDGSSSLKAPARTS